MERLIIDTDPGIDDTFALLLALKSKELQIEGITTVAGNGRLEDVTKNALKIVTMANRKDVKVYKGCDLSDREDYDVVAEIHGKDAMGDIISGDNLDIKYEQEHAVDFILRMVKANPDEITLATLGPLVNIGEAIKREPETMKKVKRIVMMGGAVKEGNVTPYAEANFIHAPESASIVFQSNIKEKVMIGLDGTNNMYISSNVREIMNQIDCELANTLFDISQTYVNFYWKSKRMVGFTPHDVLVMVYLIDPSLLEIKECNINIVTDGIAIGQSVVDFNNEFINAKVCLDVDTDKAVRLLMLRLFPDHEKDIIKALENIESRK